MVVDFQEDLVITLFADLYVYLLQTESISNIDI